MSFAFVYSICEQHITYTVSFSSCNDALSGNEAELINTH